MIWIAAAAAAHLSAPVPTSAWFQWSDYPQYAIEPDRPTVVNIRATVTPAGKLHSCEVERSSGRVEVDAMTCNLTMQRAKFRPATWSDGSPAWGVYRSTVTWVLNQPESGRAPAPADLTLTLSKLPQGIDRRGAARVTLAVDAGGGVSACDALGPDQNAILVKLACDQLQQQFQAMPVRDVDGTLVGSVQTASVEFVQAPEKRKKKKWRLF